VGIYTDDREELTLVIDTDSYSGNFEREMFSFIFGLADTPDGGTRDLSYYTKAAEIAEVSGKLPEVFQYELLDVRINDPGDDGYHRAYVTIAPTPGFFNCEGEHYPDSDKNKHALKKKTHYPAFQSVAIFLQRMPTDAELKFIKDRANKFCDLPKKHEWDTRPKILGFRILRQKTAWSSEAI
jgi:hypothetical protein